MNFLEESHGDEKRNLASRMMSPEVRKRPKLWVEGKTDQHLLMYYWQEESPLGFEIDVFSSKGKKEVIQKMNLELATVFGLVDMDHDFNGAEIVNRNLWDTNPKVTLSSYCLTSEKTFIGIVRNTCQRFGLKSISDENISKIKQLAAAYTYIKLFKGKKDIGSELSGGYGWKDIEFGTERLYGCVADLHFLNASINSEFHLFLKKYSGELAQCGLNDHALCKAITIFLNSHIAKRQTFERVENQFNQFRFMNRMPKFVERLRRRIKKNYNS